MDRRRALGIGLVVVSACAFGSGALFAKPVYAAGVGWPVLSAWRFGFGATLAWAWLMLSSERRAGLRRLPRRSVLVAVALGLLYTGNSATYYAGLETVSASLAALIVYVYPALVAVLSLRWGRRLEGRRAWSALALALLGVILAVGAMGRTGGPPISGLLLIAASPIIYSVWIVLSARLSGERPVGDPGGRPDEGTVESSGPDAASSPEAAAVTALMVTATASVYWIGDLLSGQPVLPGAVPGGAWAGLVGVGVVSTFVAIQTFYAGARRIGAAQASLVSTIEPIWTISLATLLFGESLRPVQLLGGALIIAGVVIAQTAPSGRRAARTLRLADE